MTRIGGLEALRRGGLGHAGWRENLARAYGHAHGLTSNKGSWIVNVAGAGVRCQGWWAYYRKYYSYIWQWVEAGSPAVVEVRRVRVVARTLPVEVRWDIGPGDEPAFDRVRE